MATLKPIPALRLAPETAASTAVPQVQQAPHAPHPPVTTQPRVRVVGATHHFGTRAVLNGANLEIRRGEIYGLLGPNGAGKTTLMRAICGRLRLDGGTVSVDAADPYTSATARMHIGLVPQDIALYPYLTVTENLAVFARLAGVPRAEIAGRVTDALASTGLTTRANQQCSKLSGGYQRRVNICASILHRPTLLVLDEPTVGIDLEAREEIHTLLRELRNSGTAIFLTTHDLEQAQVLSDRIGILKAGRFILEGAPADLLRQTFGGNRELIAVVGKTTVAQGVALRDLGLEPAPTPGTWACLAPPEALDLQRIARHLAAADIAVSELRVRKPDLSSLFVAALRQDHLR